MLPSLVLARSLVAASTWLSPKALSASPQCRSRPGDASFPTIHEFSQFNSSIDGRLIAVVPTAEFCHGLAGGCPNSLWTDALFRGNVPGSMFFTNWEQDYNSNPPSLCFLNSTSCGQGNVPIYGVNATTTAHIQAGIRFANAYDLKVVVKASGHDFLGRSTAKDSFLIWTRYFQNITFHDSFEVGGKHAGSAVTVGSGVPLNIIYSSAKAQGKVFVGGTAGTVAAAGGYIQGAGHSALGPLFGLAADNAIEFQVVLADGNLVIVNEITHSDLFWAIRGGGAGSWGVIISATLRTYPTFSAVHQQIVISVNDTASVNKLATIHAKHIFDWDKLNPAQYFYFRATPPTYTFTIDTVLPNTTTAIANATLTSLVDDFVAKGFNVVITSLISASINDILFSKTDVGGGNQIMGSRLWSDDVYRLSATKIGDAYQKLFDDGATGILGHLVLGGQVARNKNINSAVNPKWRTAKTHMIVTDNWADSATVQQVANVRSRLTKFKVPILASLAGPQSASYSNEADVMEPDFEFTFFGPNYWRLSAIKVKYDPDDMFIVPVGVGSERWDEAGFCKVR